MTAIATEASHASAVVPRNVRAVLQRCMCVLTGAIAVRAVFVACLGGVVLLACVPAAAVAAGMQSPAAVAAELAAPAGAASNPQPPAAAAGAPSPLDRVLVVGTKVAQPFAMLGPDGKWEGLSIDLWDRVAKQLGWKFRLEQTDLSGLLAGVAQGRFDAGVAALTITAAREKSLDFSQPFFSSGLGIAVPADRGGGVWMLLRSILSLGFIQVVLTLAGLLFGVGFVIWLFERRRNPQFDGGVLRGLGSGFWWSAVTMTTVGYGDKAPATLPGRLLAIAWMFTSVIVISSFTAGITTALTTSRLQGSVHRVSDLHSVQVGAVQGSTSVAYLEHEEIPATAYPTAQDGLKALQAHKIDAFVYDKPILAWLVQRDYGSSIELLPLVFDPQTYGIALPTGSKLREQLDQALLQAIQSNWWQQELFRYFGSSASARL